MLFKSALVSLGLAVSAVNAIPIFTNKPFSMEIGGDTVGCEESFRRRLNDEVSNELLTVDNNEPICLLGTERGDQDRVRFEFVPTNSGSGFDPVVKGRNYCLKIVRNAYFEVEFPEEPERPGFVVLQRNPNSGETQLAFKTSCRYLQDYWRFDSTPESKNFQLIQNAYSREYISLLNGGVIMGSKADAQQSQLQLLANEGVFHSKWYKAQAVVNGQEKNLECVANREVCELETTTKSETIQFRFKVNEFDATESDFINQYSNGGGSQPFEVEFRQRRGSIRNGFLSFDRSRPRTTELLGVTNYNKASTFEIIGDDEQAQRSIKLESNRFLMDFSNRGAEMNRIRGFEGHDIKLILAEAERGTDDEGFGVLAAEEPESMTPVASGLIGAGVALVASAFAVFAVTKYKNSKTGDSTLETFQVDSKEDEA